MVISVHGEVTLEWQLAARSSLGIQSIGYRTVFSHVLFPPSGFHHDGFFMPIQPVAHEACSMLIEDQLGVSEVQFVFQVCAFQHYLVDDFFCGVVVVDLWLICII